MPYHPQRRQLAGFCMATGAACTSLGARLRRAWGGGLGGLEGGLARTAPWRWPAAARQPPAGHAHMQQTKGSTQQRPHSHAACARGSTRPHMYMRAHTNVQQLVYHRICTALQACPHSLHSPLSPLCPPLALPYSKSTPRPPTATRRPCRTWRGARWRFAPLGVGRCILLLHSPLTPVGARPERSRLARHAPHCPLGRRLPAWSPPLPPLPLPRPLTRPPSAFPASLPFSFPWPWPAVHTSVGAGHNISWLLLHRAVPRGGRGPHSHVRTALATA